MRESEVALILICAGAHPFHIPLVVHTICGDQDHFRAFFLQFAAGFRPASVSADQHADTAPGRIINRKALSGHILGVVRVKVRLVVAANLSAIRSDKQRCIEHTFGLQRGIAKNQSHVQSRAKIHDFRQ